MREGAPEGSRPALGRRPGVSSPAGGQNATDAGLLSKPGLDPFPVVSGPALPVDVNLPEEDDQNNQPIENGAKIQTRPVRKTRNSTPNYVF